MAATARLLKHEIADYCLADRRWDSAVARRLARSSVAEWLTRAGADSALTAGIRGLRGFFLADPEDLSLHRARRSVRTGRAPRAGARCTESSAAAIACRSAMAAALEGKVLLQAAVRRIRQTGTAPGVRVTIEERGTRRDLEADFCVAALPASTLRDVAFEPALPDSAVARDRDAKYGDATRMLLQFERPFWRRPGRPLAFGSDLPTGAVWDAAEEQRARSGILSLLAGGRASRALRSIIASEGAPGVVGRLAWLGKPTRSHRGIHRQLGRRALVARRLRGVRSLVRPGPARMARASRGSSGVRGGTHEPAVAGLHERRDRIRQARCRRDQGAGGSSEARNAGLNRRSGDKEFFGFSFVFLLIS